MKSQMLRLGIQFDWDKVRFPHNATRAVTETRVSSTPAERRR
jgi:hypothetical protein